MRSSDDQTCLLVVSGIDNVPITFRIAGATSPRSLSDIVSRQGCFDIDRATVIALRRFIAQRLKRGGFDASLLVFGLRV